MKTKSIYFKTFEVEQQIEYHNKVKDKKTLIGFLNHLNNKYKTINEICAIIHDKDVNADGSPKAPHFHIFVKLTTSADLNWISSIFEVPCQFINKIEGKWRDALAYATHLNAPNKFPYNYDDLVLVNMTIDDYNARAQEINLVEINIKDALYRYGEMKMTRKELFEKYLNTSQLYSKYVGLYKQMRDFRMEQVRDRQMKVIYITGQSESGKTTLAKYLAQTQGYDAFVSGSGADPLDAYDKEECVILDDMRSDVFTKAELFKLTDNHTNSSVKSRFKNKDISNCKLMIITSVYAPHELYNWCDDSIESFKQFSRRLGYEYILIDKSKIFNISYDTNFDILNNKKYDIHALEFDMNMIFTLLGIQRQFGNQDFWKKVNSLTLEQIEKENENNK